MKTITPILSIVIAVLLVLFYVQPKYVEVRAIQKEITEYSTAVTKYSEFKAKLETKLQEITARSEEENNRLERLSPVNLDDVQLLVDIEHIAQSQNMLFGNVDIESSENELKSVAESDGEVPQELTTVDISFEVIGTYQQFKNLLRALEQSLTLLEVTNIEFKVAEESPFQQYAITVRAYGIPSN